MLGELIPCGGGDPIPLLKPRLLIGRRSRCDIVLEFPNVSSQHCELEQASGYWRVRDLGSRNGIKVNGTRFESNWKWLMPGDVLSVAKHRFEIKYTPQGDGPPPPEEEDVFSQSLMEKAGLVTRREEDATPPPRPARGAVPDPSPSADPDEDEAIKWLNEPDGE